MRTQVFLRLIIMVLASTLLSCATGSMTDTGGASENTFYYVYATAESEDEVAVIRFDGQNAEVVKTIQVGVWPVEIEGPHGITISPDGRHWYLSMAHGFPYGHVYKYTTGSDEVLGRVELDLFPATLQMSPSTGLLYVVNFNLHGDHVPSSVSVVDPESLTEIERITTGVMPHGSRLSPDGMRHYSVAMMSDELFEIDATSLQIKRRLNLVSGQAGDGHSGHMGMSGEMDHSPKAKPTWVYPHPTKNFVYVAHNGADEVSEVDLDKWQIVRKFKTGKGPYNLEVSPDGTKLVVSYKSEGATGIWDLKEGKELAKIPNSRKVTHGVVISPDSRYAFVTVEGKGAQPGAVDIFDLNSLKHMATAEMGKQAGGIAFWKMANK